jgi:hypothetical protein
MINYNDEQKLFTFELVDNQRSVPLSVSSSFVHGLSISVHPLKALLSNVRSTAASGFPSWQTRSFNGRRLGFLNDSGNSLSGHSHTLQSRNRHIPSSGQKGQLHHSLAYRRYHLLIVSTEETHEGQQKGKIRSNSVTSNIPTFGALRELFIKYDSWTISQIHR